MTTVDIYKSAIQRHQRCIATTHTEFFTHFIYATEQVEIKKIMANGLVHIEIYLKEKTAVEIILATKFTTTIKIYYSHLICSKIAFTRGATIISTPYYIFPSTHYAKDWQYFNWL